MENLDGKNILGVYGRDFGEEFQSIILTGILKNIKGFVVTIKDLAGVETSGVKYIFKI